MAYDISEYGRYFKPHKNYNEYMSDSFDDLPMDAQFGDRAILVEGTTMGFAIVTTQGWVSNDGRIKPIILDDKKPSNSEAEVIAVFDGKNTLNFEVSYDVGDDPVYMATIPFDKTLDANTVYTFMFDENPDNLIKVYTMINEDAGDLFMGQSCVSDDHFMIMIDSGMLMVATESEKFVGKHTMKILKDSADLDKNYVIRVFIADDGDHTLDLVASDLVQDNNYVVSFTLSSSQTPIEIEEGVESTNGLLGFIDYDIPEQIYNALSNGDKVTVTLKDKTNNTEVFSSSDVFNSKCTNGYTGYECYCWGNEYILPYGFFGT